jgi:putative molybdopterin biosynthesis protein
VAVVAADADADTPGRDRVDAADLAGWRREWGLVVPAGNPAGVAGLADLVDRDLRLANRGTESGLRTSLANAVAALAADRGVDRHDVVESIDGFGFATRGVESPARRVLADDADAGLGLRVTADRLDAGFVPLGWQDVRVLATPVRVDKPGVRALVDAVDAGDAIDALPGYERA